MPSVLVAMSGGVDSSVAACLLHEQGYEVLGSHLSLVHLEGVEHGCCGPSARRDAEETARIAGFPFEICDLSDEFERTVIADFLGELASGRTPNPCARCNGEIKFGAFLRRADELGIDLVATGHYVRAVRDDRGTWQLWGGAVVDPEGRVLAEHDGTFAFTVGQRRGLGVATGSPMYVTSLDAASNRVVVGPRELLTKRGLIADRVSWVAGGPPHDGPFEADVRIRYRGSDVPAVISPRTDATIEVEFRSPQRSVAPGQSVVVYNWHCLL